MIELWERQPYKTEAQHNAIKLNLALLKKDYAEAEKLVGKIEAVFDSDTPSPMPMRQTKLPSLLGKGKGWHKESQRHSDARYKGMR
jgi:hypothetical protein